MAFTGTIGSTCTGRLSSPQEGQMVLEILTLATADTGDTIAFTMQDHGGYQLLGVEGWNHTTENSIMVIENPTTSTTAAGVVTLTLASTAGNETDKKRYIRVYMRSGPDLS